MKKEKKKESFSYPSKEEMKAAQLACCGRICSACETPAEYAWRKREVDMSLILEKAIKQELTETEREVVVAYWYDGNAQKEIAEKRGISPEAVKGTLNRAQKKLERVLGYAVFYQQNVISESIVPLAIGRARVIAAARNAKGGNPGDRMLRLRQSQCLSIDALSHATGIAPSRLKKIENGTQPDCDEIIAFSEFFEISTDYILKGESNVRN